jgi:hypothetical protein
VSGAPNSPDDDAMALGIHLAQACAPAFVFMQHLMTEQQRVDFVRAFFSSLSGMAEQAIGYQASRDTLTFVAELKPVGSTHPLQ